MAEYLGATTSREIAEQDALVRVDGPQGQDRLDLCFAWLASFWLAKRDETTVRQLHGDLISTLRKQPAEDDEIAIIDDNPELSRQREAELTAKVFTFFPHEAKKE